jgi:hypothetical protein
MFKHFQENTSREHVEVENLGLELKRGELEYYTGINARA